MSIFVSIASYCDELLSTTIESLFANAARPDAVFAGVVEQSLRRSNLPQASAHASNIRYLFVDYRDSHGVCWARSLASSLYQGEDWYLQIDSHTLFDQGWDQYFISLAQSCQRRNERVILSSYPNAFRIENGEFRKVPIRDRVIVHALDEGSRFSENSAFLQYRGVGIARREPVIGGHLAAGSIFAKGDLFCEVPYDPFLYFREEEQSLAVRSFTHGWDIHHVANSPLYHLYAKAGSNGAARKLHWDAGHQLERPNFCAAHRHEASQRRMLALLSGQAGFGAYGLGGARSLDEYAQAFGIDYRNRKISPYAYARKTLHSG